MVCVDDKGIFWFEVCVDEGEVVDKVDALQELESILTNAVERKGLEAVPS